MHGRTLERDGQAKANHLFAPGARRRPGNMNSAERKRGRRWATIRPHIPFPSSWGLAIGLNTSLTLYFSIDTRRSYCMRDVRDQVAKLEYEQSLYLDKSDENPQPRTGHHLQSIALRHGNKAFQTMVPPRGSLSRWPEHRVSCGTKPWMKDPLGEGSGDGPKKRWSKSAGQKALSK